jgi:hypothetical protein
MSIVRIGLAETKNYSDGWNAVFGKGKGSKPAKTSAGGGKKKKKVKAKKK